MTAVFRDINSAIRFVLNYSMQQYDRPLINRLASGPGLSRTGLSGIDGAGQAGMVHAELARLPEIYQAALVASLAAPDAQCDCGSPCCNRTKPNAQWEAAISYLVDEAAAGALSGCISNRSLRQGLIKRNFGQRGDKLRLEYLANRAGVGINTAANHNARIKLWLLGRPETPKREAERGILQIARERADQQLRAAGMVGDIDD